MKKISLNLDNVPIEVVVKYLTEMVVTVYWREKKEQLSYTAGSIKNTNADFGFTWQMALSRRKSKGLSFGAVEASL